MYEKKWLVAVLILLACFLLWTALTAADFFFKEWRAYQAYPATLGGVPVVIIMAENPDPEGKIKAVKMIATMQGEVVGYAYFDEKSDPIQFVVAKDGYQRDATIEATCCECHKDKRKTSL